ncbi:MAG: copper-binding protein [Phycisphaeraceae bacterium]
MHAVKQTVTALTLALLATLTVGCGGDTTDQPAGDVYETRGVIRQLPTDATGDLQIEHEPVPDFKDQDGEVVGMDSMTMPFPPADDVSLDGLAVGDKVRFTFVWRWDENSWTVTAIEKLPADTELDLGGGDDDGGDDDEHGDHSNHDHH